MKKILFIILLCGFFISCDNVKEKNIQNTKEQSYLVSEGGDLDLFLTNIDTLNPIYSENKSYYYFSKLIYDSLVDMKQDGSIALGLAESIVKKSKNSYYIKLRDNIKFHDGSQFDADDVLFTYNLIASGHTQYVSLFINEFTPASIKNPKDACRISKISNNEILVTFNNLSQYNLYSLIFPILSSGDKMQDYKPNGTGAFKFVAYEPNKEISLEKFDSYFDGAGSINNIRGIIMDNEEIGRNVFETGKVDVFYRSDNDESFLSDSRYNSIDFLSNRLIYLAFNFNKKPDSQEYQGLRRIVRELTDSESISKNMYNNKMETSYSIYPYSSIFTDKVSNDKKEYNTMYSRNKNGVMVDKKNRVADLKILVKSNDDKLKKIANAIMIKLEEKGIKASLCESDNIKKSDWDLMVTETYTSFLPTVALSFRTNAPNNFINFSNKEYDDIINKLLYDDNQNIKDFYKIGEFIKNNCFIIPIGYLKESLCIKNNIVGEFKPTFINVYKGIKDAYITTENVDLEK